MKEKTERAKYWEGIIAEQAETDGTIRAFCEERQLSQASFYWWRRELQGLNKRRAGRRSGKTAGTGATAFVEVVASPGSVCCGSSGVALRLHDGVSVVLDPGFDRDTLSAVLELLRGADQCSR
jgi:hypothetical protein